MSIFGSLGGMLGGLVEQYGGPQGLAGQALTQMGGVQGVLGKLQQAGLGGQVQSWLGNDPNQPISADQITGALGHGPLGDIASKFGIPQEQLSQVLAHALPGLIDKISPNGTPEPHLMGDAAGAAPTDPTS